MLKCFHLYESQVFVFAGKNECNYYVTKISSSINCNWASTKLQKRNAIITIIIAVIIA